MFGERRLFIPEKVKYVKERHRGEVSDCILCEIVAGTDRYKNLIVAEHSNFCITLNLYPYNPGHLMVFPEKHIEDLRELSEEEILVIHKLTKITMDIIDEVYMPSGYNVGYNLGKYSGASIKHLHSHIVPRYRNELGLLDIVSGSRIIVDDPLSSRDLLRGKFMERLK